MGAVPDRRESAARRLGSPLERLQAASPSLTPSDTFRRNDIQGLRAFAVVCVIAYHAGLPLPGGFTGVDIFFVISGFVITGMLLREQGRTGTIRLGSFYWRRFKRLSPALSLMLTISLLLAIPVLSPFGQQQEAATTAGAAVFLVANIQIARTMGDYFGGPAEGNLFLNTWSLSVEEQFYIVFPVLLGVAWWSTRRRSSPRSIAIAVVGGIALLSFGLACIGATGFSLDRYFWLLGFFSPLTRAWEFAAGALLAMVSLSSEWRHARVAARYLGIFGVALMLVSLWAISGGSPYPGMWTLLPVMGTLFVLAAGSLNSTCAASRLFSRPLFVRTGDLSYSLYLWHWPFIVLASAIWGSSVGIRCLAVAVAIGPAVASYAWVENPLRHANFRGSISRMTLFACCILAPIVAALVVLAGAKAIWGLTMPDRPVFGSGSYGLSHCMRLARSEATSPLVSDECHLGAKASKSRIVLLGDSQSAQWAEALNSAGLHLGAEVRVGTAPGCPFIDIGTSTLAGAGAAGTACRENYRVTMQILRETPPSTVVIAQSGDYWRDSRSPHISRGLDNVDRALALKWGLRKTILDLQAAGHQVVLVVPTVRTMIEGASLNPVECSTWMVYRGECFKPFHIVDLDADELVARNAIVGVASELHLRTVDPLPLQCPEGTCYLWVDEVPIYSDGSHTSAEFGLRVAPLFLDSIR